MMRPRLRLLIVEDEPDWSAIYAHLVSASDRFEVACIAGSAAQARAAIDTMQFDLALLDLGLGDGSGIEVLEALSMRQPGVLSAICTVFEDEENVLRAIRSGASGYLLKHEAVGGLIDLLETMVAGGAPLSPRIARHLLREISGPTAGQRPGPVPQEEFTPRERDVLRSVAEGRSLKQVGRELGIAESTVRTHVKNLYSKLGVNRRSAAVLEASRRNLL